MIFVARGSDRGIDFLASEGFEVTFFSMPSKFAPQFLQNLETFEFLVWQAGQILIFLFLLLISTPNLPTYILSPSTDNGVIVLAVAPALGVVLSLRDYHYNKQGMKGEKKVKQLLDSEFGDEYLIINDVEYAYNDKNGKANIDHIVLAPNGIFVIETKATKG